MGLTLRWWERGTFVPTAVDHLPISTKFMGGLQPTLNGQASLLRSRFYPSLALKQTSVTTPGEFDWQNAVVEFVAWYDLNGTGSLPQPDDLDTRIVCTGRLYPTYSPSAGAATTSFRVTWEPREGVLQSFGQRNPQGLAVSAAVSTGIWFDNPGGPYYTAHASTSFLLSCYAEALFGI